MYQLDFFKTEEEQMWEEIEKVRKSSDKVRKGIYARHAELAKMYMELQNEFQNLKRAMCRGENHEKAV